MQKLTWCAMNEGGSGLFAGVGHMTAEKMDQLLAQSVGRILRNECDVCRRTAAPRLNFLADNHLL